MRPLAAVDYETKSIERRPLYPPKPVGVSIYIDGQEPEYLAWGHPSENNSTEARARDRLQKLYRTHEVVFHNSAFDCDVGNVHQRLQLTPDSYHDTMFLAFLIDPRAHELSLKPLAEKWLGMKPRERDKLKDWVLRHVPNATEKSWGAYISEAPGGLVGEYAKGDTVRTLKLFKKLYAEVQKLDRRWPAGEGQQTMMQAYARELRLMPVILSMERRGVRVDVRRLGRDVPKWCQSVVELEKYIVQRLGGRRAVAKFAKAGESFNVGSNAQLANALDAAGLVTHWIKTKKGNRSVAKDALATVISDKKLAEALQRREVLSKYVSTYGEKWLTMNANGFVYPRINQVRNREDERSGLKGARTGRLSYSDSWQAIPAPDRRPFADLPNLRDYVISDDDDSVVLVRDYSQQEFRILAHYENGPLQARYKADPTLDMHDGAREMILELTGIEFERRPVKDTGFGLIYGMGLEKTAKKTGQDLETAKLLRASYLKAIPGFKALQDEIRRRCKRDEPIRTWGGRLYWVEEPKIIDGRLRTFDYKMINVLVQGSAGDCTKEAMIHTDVALDKKKSRLLLQVHDELALSAKRKHFKTQMAALRESMESVKFDVKMLSDGKWSARSWGSLKPYDDGR